MEIVTGTRALQTSQNPAADVRRRILKQEKLSNSQYISFQISNKEKAQRDVRCE
jgi:hypothetical protein